jgi:magnesium transporter
MSAQKLFTEIAENLETVIQQESPYGISLWREFIEQHEADIADFLQDLSLENFKRVFVRLPREKRVDVFHELSDVSKVKAITFLPDEEAVEIFNKLTADELADLFDLLSDEELKKYLNLLHKQVREKVLSLLKFDPESAGGIMTTDVFSLVEDYTVTQSIKLLQRLQPDREIHHQVFVVNRQHHLVGHINLEDLLLHKPEERISHFLRKNELVARPEQDQETIAKQMVHYNITIVPVADDDYLFLGIITGETLVDVLVEEASEDASRMAGVVPSKYPYFQTSLLRLFYQRGHILAVLLIVESFSSTILHAYESTLGVALYSFIPMLISVGGNTSSQTSAMVIQGMTSGEITFANVFRFLKREILVGSLLAMGLSVVAFVRVMYSSGGSLQESFVVSLAIGLIVLLAAMLGSGTPLVLKRFNIDPAFSAGPFLATVMDILGVLIFCYLSKLILVW